MVNPDADGRGWTGDAAEEPGRSGERHPPARPHDRHRIQLPPRLRLPPALALAALAVPDPLRRQRYIPASPGGQHADR